RTGAPVVCDAAVRAMLIDEGVSPDQVSATTWGIVVEIAGLQIRPVECHHWSSGTLSDGSRVVGNPIAFIVETEPGVRIYHYGDTCIFDMRLIGELYRPTVGLLGCTLPKELSHRIPGPATFLTGEMDADEAARVAEMLGLERAAVATEEVAGAALLAPIRPGKTLCSGVNYASHLDENPGATLPTEPFFFSKLPSAVIGPGAAIVIPRDGTLVDYEVELALVIGAGGRRIRE